MALTTYENKNINKHPYELLLTLFAEVVRMCVCVERGYTYSVIILVLKVLSLSTFHFTSLQIDILLVQMPTSLPPATSTHTYTPTHKYSVNGRWLLVFFFIIKYYVPFFRNLAI